MKVVSLLEGINETDINKILKNIEGNRIKYKKNEKIILDNNNYEIIGLIMNGFINIEKYDYNGNRIIIEKMGKNSIFGNLFINFKNDISIVATSDCEVLYFNYDILIRKNKNLIVNLMEIYTKKIIDLNIRIEVLSKRSIRDKLMTYFLIISNYKKNKKIILPWTYTDLADYLSMDRSAMMREIKKLKEEGIIKIDDKKITIISY